jgi:hypothetical protein
MALDMLGHFPQIPFMLSSASNSLDEADVVEKLTSIMSVVDGVEYPSYRE